MCCCLQRLKVPLRLQDHQMSDVSGQATLILPAGGLLHGVHVTLLALQNQWTLDNLTTDTSMLLAV